jgi:hypothetical protein
MIDQNKLYPGEAQIMNTETTDRTHIYRLFEEAIIYQRINNVPVWNGYNKVLIDTEINERTQYKIVYRQSNCRYFQCLQARYARS